MQRFEVHAHTMYSNLRLLDCINRPKELLKRAKEIGLKGIAITDHDAVCCHVEINMITQDMLKEDPEFKLAKNPKFKNLLPLEFTYGYAITTHKAQGSEWDKVLILEERFPFDKIEHARWLYTAVTRAAEKVVLVR